MTHSFTHRKIWHSKTLPPIVVKISTRIPMSIPCQECKYSWRCFWEMAQISQGRDEGVHAHGALFPAQLHKCIPLQGVLVVQTGPSSALHAAPIFQSVTTINFVKLLPSGSLTFLPRPTELTHSWTYRVRPPTDWLRWREGGVESTLMLR